MKAQAMVLDLAVSVLIIILVVVIAFNLYLPKSDGEIVKVDAQILANNFFNPYPVPYNASNVIRPGFVVNHRYNSELASVFQSLSENDIRRLSGVMSNFYVNVSKDGNVLFFYGLTPYSADNLYVINRFAAYNGSIVVVEVGAWR